MAIVWHGVIIKVCSENGKSVMTISLHDDKWVSIWADDKALPFLLSLLELSLLLLWGAARLRQQQQAAKLISWNDRSPRPWLYHHGTRQPKREHQDGQGPNSSDLGYIFQIYKFLLGRLSHAQFLFCALFRSCDYGGWRNHARSKSRCWIHIDLYFTKWLWNKKNWLRRNWFGFR